VFFFQLILVFMSYHRMQLLLRSLMMSVVMEVLVFVEFVDCFEN